MQREAHRRTEVVEQGEEASVMPYARSQQSASLSAQKGSIAGLTLAACRAGAACESGTGCTLQKNLCRCLADA